MAKQTHRNCQNFIYRNRGVSYENCFSSNIWSFFDAPALWAECSEPFRGKRRNGCQNRILRVQKINFLVEILKYPQMFLFQQSFLSFFVGKSTNGCQNRILPVKNINFLVKILKYPQMFTFLVLTANNSLRKFFGRVVKSVLVWTTLIFWGKLVFWRFVSFFFLVNWKKN